MSGAARPGRRGRWASFAADPGEPEPIDPLPSLGPVVFTLSFGDGDAVVDLSRWPCPRLTRPIGETLRQVGGQDGTVRSWPSMAGLVNSARRFVEYLADVLGPAADRLELAEVEPRHLDGFERALVEQYGAGSGRPHGIVMRVVRVLRAVHDHGHAVLSRELVGRLGFTTRHSGPGLAPLDAYPAPVFEAVKQAALRDVQAIADRIAAGEALAEQGTDPQVGGWDSEANALWQIMRHGPLTVDDVRAHYELGHKLGGIWRLNSRLYLNAHDLIPFVILLVCLTGMEPSSVERLRADCLSSPARGFVTIRYRKPRDRVHPDKTMRVSDGGALHHPGGVIRLALRLTRRGRSRIGGDLLWIDHGHQGTRETFAQRRRLSINGMLGRWLARHELDGLLDADGAPVQLDLRRLRKSFKSQQYLKAAGVLADFAAGHTRQVAAAHYADIASHTEVHEQAVEDGLLQALKVADPPEAPAAGSPGTSDPSGLPDPVVVDDDGTVLGGEITGTTAGGPPAQVARALGGEQDVFLASCRDFHHTPFAAAGKPCPVPMWGCLECPNAVFTTRHLPQVLAFLDFVERQREQMPVPEWQLRYGTAWDRLVHGVRAKFSNAQVRTAQAITEAGGSRLLVPPQLWETIL